MCACKVGYGGLQEFYTSSSFTTTLNRMVGGLKRKRKSLAAQHALLLDLLACPPTPASFIVLFPLLNSRDGICHSLGQISASPPPSPDLPMTSRTANATPLHNDTDTGRSYPCLLHPEKSTVAKITAPHLLPQANRTLQKKNTPCPDLWAAPRALWAALLLALLATFLYTGKQAAVKVAMVSYLVLGLSWKLKVVTGGAWSCTLKSGCKSLGCRGRGKSRDHLLLRSSTAPRRSRGVGRPFMLLGWKRRSKSFTSRLVHDSSQGEKRTTMKAGAPLYSASSSCKHGKTVPSERGRVSARMKMHMVIVVVLCGLIHGRILALCMALSCIYIVDSIKALCKLNFPRAHMIQQ